MYRKVYKIWHSEQSEPSKYFPQFFQATLCIIQVGPEMIIMAHTRSHYIRIHRALFTCVYFKLCIKNTGGISIGFVIEILDILPSPVTEKNFPFLLTGRVEQQKT